MKCVVVFVLIKLSVAEIMIRGAVPIVVVHKLLVSDWKDFLGDEFIIVHSRGAGIFVCLVLLFLRYS